MDLSVLIEQIAAQDWIEWTGLITGVIYVILATYEKPSCWLFGIISSAAIAWKSFFEYKLMADGFLQAFYIIMGLIGLWQWVIGRTGNNPKAIVTSPLMYHVIAVASCLILSDPLSYFLVEYLGAKYGYLDTVFTLGSIWATILLVRKDLHNWIYWIVLDFMLIFLYFVSQAYLFSALFVIYTVISFVAYRQWSHSKRHGEHGVYSTESTEHTRRKQL